MRHTYFILLCLFSVIFGFAQAPITTIDRLNGPGPTATDNVASLSSVGLTRGTGLNQAGADGLAAFISNNFSNTPPGDLAAAQANDDYLQWSVTANTAFEVTVDDIDIRLRRNANGPSDWQIFWSTDNFATAGNPIASPQTLAANTTTVFNLATINGSNLGILSGVSGTITFRLYAWGAVANNGQLRVIRQPSWSISPAVTEPGIRLIGSAATSSTNSIESDIAASALATQNIDYTAFDATSGLSIFPFPNAIIIGEFTVRDGGSDLTDADTAPTILTSIGFNVLNSDNIAALAIFSGFTNVAEVSSVSPITNFSGLNLVAPDNGSTTFFVAATFKSLVTDNQQIQLTVNTVTSAGTGSSLFAEANAGGAATSVSGDDNRIEVVATEFDFDQQPTDGNELEIITAFPTLLAVDANGNQDLDVDITGISVTGGSVIPETYDMLNGFAVLNNVIFSSSETGVSLTANGGSFTGVSDSFNVNGPLLDIAQQNFDTETGWTYSSDTGFFGTVSDWADGLGYYNEIAIADASIVLDSDNYVLNSTLNNANNLSLSPGWAVSGGTLNFLDTFDGTQAVFALNETITPGDYLIEFDLVASNNARFAVLLTGGGSTTVAPLAFYPATGVITIPYTHTDAERTQFVIQASNSAGAGTFSVDNISLIRQDTVLPVDNVLFNDEIFGENKLNDSPNPFATLTLDDVDVSSFSNIRVEFDWQVFGYVNNANDVQYRLVIDGSTAGTGGWQTVFNGNGDVNNDEGRIKISIPDGTLTVGLQVRVRNNLARGYSGLDNFRVVSEFDGLIYTDAGGWRNNNSPDATTGAEDALVIDGTYNVSGNVQVNNFTILADGTTSIPVAQSLRVNGNLNTLGTLELNSVSDTYSSLIVNGSATGDVTYFRHVNQFASTGAVTGLNDLIAAPVTSPSQDFLAFRNANPDLPSGTIGGVPSFLFGPFDNNSNDYINYTASNDSDPLEAGIGYRTASIQTGGSPFTFIGNVVTNDVTVGISIGSSSDFNLIGNPYPSYLSLSGFLLENNPKFNALTSGVYGYDGDATDGFVIWNQAFSDANPNAVIAPGQGFLVSSAAVSDDINFLTTMRATGTADDFIPGRMANPETYIKHLKLKLEQDERSFFTDVYFTDNATLGMDSGYDSALFGDLPQVALYSNLVEGPNNEPLGVQSVGFDATVNVSIPLGLHASPGQELSIRIDQSTLATDTEVYLEDRLNNTFTLLNDAAYTLTPNTVLVGTGRYYLSFSRNQLGVDDTSLSNLRITAQSNPKTITISGTLNTETRAEVYDIQGRLMLQQQLSTDKALQTLDASNLSSGIYIVNLQSTNAKHAQKVIIK